MNPVLYISYVKSQMCISEIYNFNYSEHDTVFLQERLGHADIRTTMNIYSHVTMEMQKDATEKLSNLFTYSEAKNK